jgi:hypothetical protein
MNAYANYNQIQIIDYTEATFGIKLSCVPKGYNTEELTKYLFENVLGIGAVKSVSFQNSKNEQDQAFVSTFVQFHYFNSMSNEVNYLKGLPYGANVKCYIPPTMQFKLPDGRGIMTYLSLQSYQIPTKANNRIPLLLLPTAWTSLHIPVITEMWLTNNSGNKGKFIPRRDLQDLIENHLCIGKVRRIDFVERDDMEITPEGKIQRLDPETEKPETESGVEAAFIHMDTWYNNKNALRIRSNIETYSQHHIKGFRDTDNNFQQYEFVTYDDVNRYFVLKENHKPIPDADGKLNIHQLSALKTKLDEEVLQLKKDKEELTTRLAKWEKPEEEKKTKPKYESDLLQRLEEAAVNAMADNKHDEDYAKYAIEDMV